MQKYQKPIARNLGDLQPALGYCQSGNSATGGPFAPCGPGSGATSFGGECVDGNYASGAECSVGNSASNACNSGSGFGAYPYG